MLSTLLTALSHSFNNKLYGRQAPVFNPLCFKLFNGPDLSRERVETALSQPHSRTTKPVPADEKVPPRQRL